MSIIKGKQYRTMTLKAQDYNNRKLIDTDYYVEGYATTWERYVLFETEEGPIYEQFLADNFTNVDLSDVIMQFDHHGQVLARTKNNTLKLAVDDNGLFIAADLSKTEKSKQIYEEISTGMIDKMSWSFIPGKMYYNEETKTITYESIKKIFDVSAVSIPANDTTTINTRNFINKEIEKVKNELLKRENQKKRILLKLLIGGI